MFDIDGTLINSSSFEDDLYIQAVSSVIHQTFDVNWENYTHVSDAGILDQIIKVNDILYSRESIHLKVKTYFINLIKKHLENEPVKQIPGASEFINYLKVMKNVEIAIATGGWEETAKLKLRSAGINISGISFASSSDHKQRIEIMRQAELRCVQKKFSSKTYFGDAIWDKRASKKLNYNFILVGNSINNVNQITDYRKIKNTAKMIGL